MVQHRTPEIDKLYQNVLEYRSTRDFKKLLEFIKRFRDLAPYNAMLVHVQKPGSVYVASAYDWEHRFQRKIKPGARPLLILKPFGPVSYVFEYNDTEGKPLPDELINPFRTKTIGNSKLLNVLLHNVSYEGIKVCQQHYGTHRAGQIQCDGTKAILKVKAGTKEYSILSRYTIVINEEMTPAEKFTTMLHELGHFYCGHLNYVNEKWLPIRTFLGKEQREFEAETACWIVCERLGIESPSIRYLSGYLKDNKYIPDVSIDAILKAAGMIETLLNGHAKPRKELVIKLNEG